MVPLDVPSLYWPPKKVKISQKYIADPLPPPPSGFPTNRVLVPNRLAGEDETKLTFVTCWYNSSTIIQRLVRYNDWFVPSNVILPSPIDESTTNMTARYVICKATQDKLIHVKCTIPTLIRTGPCQISFIFKQINNNVGRLRFKGQHKVKLGCDLSAGRWGGRLNLNN